MLRFSGGLQTDRPLQPVVGQPPGLFNSPREVLLLRLQDQVEGSLRRTAEAAETRFGEYVAQTC